MKRQGWKSKGRVTGAESGGGRVVEIYGKTGREGKGRKAEGRVRDGDKEEEILAFGVQLLQRAGTKNFPWFSVDLCPRLGSQERWLIMSH